MSGERRRLWCRDLAAASAFASMAISGAVPLWAVALFGVSLALALAGRRVLSRYATVTAGGLVVGAVALYGSAWTHQMDLIVASCSFASLITAHRLLSAPSASTDSQIHLTSLLMLAGGAALSGELLFAVSLALFAVFGTLSLGLGVFADAGVAAPRAAIRQLAWGACIALIGSAAFFILFPRLSWNVAARQVSRGLGAPVTGFGETVDLGRAVGTIKTSSRPVLRAELSPDPGDDELRRYWVGRTYDVFDGRAWQSGAVARRPTAQVTVRPSAPGSMNEKIELLPAYGSRTLVALDRPARFARALGLGSGAGTHVDLVELAGREVRFAAAFPSYSYLATSLPPEKLDAPDPEADLSRIRALPPRLDPRVAALAASVAPGEPDPLRLARALESYVRNNYRYTLDLGDAAADPLAAFLFDRRAGHCEYFATALAVLLRARGIPSRVVAGFYGGERAGRTYLVRAGDAHLWTEAWIDGRFVHLDATPEANRSAQTSALWDWMNRLYDAIDAWWRTQVLDYSLRDQADLASHLVSPPKWVSSDRLPEQAPRWAISVALVLLLGWAVRRVARRRDPAREATRLRDGIERVTSRARLPDEPLEEMEHRLKFRRHPGGPALSRATRRYLEARFGGASLSGRERRALVADLAKRIW